MSEAESQERVFKALADRRRREMLDLLKEGPRTTGEMCSLFPGIDRCTVMQHLRVLERAGLVVVRREGRIRWNYLDVVPIREVYERWISPYASTSAELLTRMKRDMHRR